MHIQLLIAFILLIAVAGDNFATASTTSSVFRNRTSKQEPDLRERLTTLRALSTAIIRQSVTPEQRSKSMAALDKACQDEEPVIRLNAHVELLKISASEKDQALTTKAMQAIEDKNINVRRGMLKYFRSFYSGRFDFGKGQQEILQNKLNDPDLESRFHAAATLFSWGISNEKILDNMLDSLELQNYRSATNYALVQSEHRLSIIKKTLMRMDETDANTAIYINLLALLVPESKDTLIRILPYFESEDVVVRAAVIDAIGRIGARPKLSLQILSRAADDSSSVIRRLVIPSLIRVDSDRTKLRDMVLKLIADKDELVTQTSGNAFSLFEGQFQLLTPALTTIFNGGDKQQILAALGGCVTAGPLAAEATSGVLELLSHDDFEIRTSACWALFEIAPNREVAVEALNTMLERESDHRVIATILETIARFEPRDEKSKIAFTQFLSNSNQYVRFSCVLGLKPYRDPELASKLLKTECEHDVRFRNQLSKFDQTIVDAVVDMGPSSVKAAEELLDDPDPYVRSRAIRVVGASKIDDASVRQKIVTALGDSNNLIRNAAAQSIANFDDVLTETLENVFSIMNPSNRQQTTSILNILSQMGAKASPITPKIASLMNGNFRNRFANDAKQALMAMGPNAAPATQELLTGKLNLLKIECLSAIGSEAKAAIEPLAAFIKTQDRIVSDNNSIRGVAIARRNRLAAVMALWRITGETELASAVIREELRSKSNQAAMLAAGQFAAADRDLIIEIISLLPEKTALNTLAEIGPSASAAVKTIEAIAASDDASMAHLAHRALWRIQDDPLWAIETIEEIIVDNRYELVEIRVEDRQRLWEAIRFVHQKRGSDETAKSMIDKLNQSRFPNLRAFIQQLPRS